MELKENPKINKTELRRIYASIGKFDYDYNLFKKGLKKAYVLGAYIDDKLIGFISAISDNTTIVYVKELTIDAHYDKAEIATYLLKRLKEYYQAVPKIILTQNIGVNDEVLIVKNAGFHDMSENGIMLFEADSK